MIPFESCVLAKIIEIKDGMAICKAVERHAYMCHRLRIRVDVIPNSHTSIMVGTVFEYQEIDEGRYLITRVYTPEELAQGKHVPEDIGHEF